MKLKKIIIKKYDKIFKIFEMLKPPSHFVYNIYLPSALKTSKVELIIRSQFALPIKDILPFLVGLTSINDLPNLKLSTWYDISVYKDSMLFPWMTSVLVHSFLFYTFFYETAFLFFHNFKHKTYEIETQLGKPKQKKLVDLNCFKNFYIPFIYFLVFESLKYKP